MNMEKQIHKMGGDADAIQNIGNDIKVTAHDEGAAIKRHYFGNEYKVIIPEKENSILKTADVLLRHPSCDGYEVVKTDNKKVISQNEIRKKEKQAYEEGREDAVNEGDIPEEQIEYIKLEAWKEALGSSALCSRCHDNSAESAHHLIPRKFEHSYNLLQNLEPLCDECHNEVEPITERLLERHGTYAYGPDTLRKFVRNGFPADILQEGDR